MFDSAATRGLPILIPSVCWYTVLLKLNCTHLVAKCISFGKIGSGTGGWGLGGCSIRRRCKWRSFRRVDTLLYKLTISKERKNSLLSSMCELRIWFTKVNESLMKYWKYNCTTGSSISANHLSANHLSMLRWAEPTIDRIGLNRVFCVFWGVHTNVVFVIRLGVFFRKSFLV